MNGPDPSFVKRQLEERIQREKAAWRVMAVVWTVVIVAVTAFILFTFKAKETVAKTETRLETAAKNYVGAEKEVQRLGKAVNEVDGAGEIARLQRELDAARESWTKKEAAYTEQIGALQRAVQSTDATHYDAVKAKADIADLTAKLDAARADNEQLKAQLAASLKRIEGLKEEVRKVRRVPPVVDLRRTPELRSGGG